MNIKTIDKTILIAFLWWLLRLVFTIKIFSPCKDFLFENFKLIVFFFLFFKNIINLTELNKIIVNGIKIMKINLAMNKIFFFVSSIFNSQI